MGGMARGETAAEGLAGRGLAAREAAEVSDSLGEASATDLGD